MAEEESESEEPAQTISSLLPVQSWRIYLLSSDEAPLEDFTGEVAFAFVLGLGVSPSESESESDEEELEEDEEEEEEAGVDALEVAFDFFAFLVDASDEDELESEDARRQ